MTDSIPDISTDIITDMETDICILIEILSWAQLNFSWLERLSIFSLSKIAKLIWKISFLKLLYQLSDFWKLETQPKTTKHLNKPKPNQTDQKQNCSSN